VLIALLAVLGVNLIVLVALAVVVIGRRRWLARQPGQFSGAIRVSDGTWKGLGPRWKRGSGRQVGGVLIWHKAPFLFRSELVRVDRLVQERPALTGEVRRLGDDARVVAFTSDHVVFEVATAADDRGLLTAPRAVLTHQRAHDSPDA